MTNDADSMRKDLVRRGDIVEKVRHRGKSTYLCLLCMHRVSCHRVVEGQRRCAECHRQRALFPDGEWTVIACDTAGEALDD